MSQPTRILLSLILGLIAGIGSIGTGGAWVDDAVAVAQPVGDTWLNGLRMTIVPLVVALLVTGIAGTAETARSGRVAARSLFLFFSFLVAASALSALLTPAYLALFPLPQASAAALKSSLIGAQAVSDVAGMGDFLKSLIPTNPVAAAANDAIVPLIVFTMAFAFAITRLPDVQRKMLTAFFQAIADAMLVMVGWVLWLAPLGVGALAYVVGARAGSGAVGALVHYILIVSAVGVTISLIAYPVAMIGGRRGLVAFARSIAPAQAIAISTQSSLASLPAMLRGAGALGVPVATSGVVLPLAVAVFRVTAPPMNLAVMLYVAHWYGIALSPAQYVTAVAVASITTFSGVGLPGQITFYAGVAPIGLAIGVPIEALGLLIAVETIPDIFRTIGNVTMDVAVTTVISERVAGSDESSEADALLNG
ncbi:MAG: dicarboxylate/amino acid:cation symporter [Sphingomonas sp.]|uniref:dicarboxylate/amino acid:cation symporter n=1 Tax=Sphingomonas sp. TaxID=28214 RepID=UPI001810C6D4|nr:sodium:dicarboxylate symporter [Zymomonas sp.]MBA4772042.1 dicarboxylate/amino acid:cation symporter [Sphingomonas sp.]